MIERAKMMFWTGASTVVRMLIAEVNVSFVIGPLLELLQGEPAVEGGEYLEDVVGHGVGPSYALRYVPGHRDQLALAVLRHDQRFPTSSNLSGPSISIHFLVHLQKKDYKMNDPCLTRSAVVEVLREPVHTEVSRGFSFSFHPSPVLPAPPSHQQFQSFGGGCPGTGGIVYLTFLIGRRQ